MLLHVQLMPPIRMVPVFLRVWLFCFLPAMAYGQYWQSVQLDTSNVHQYNGGFLGGGLTSADFNKDGYDDLLFCQRASNPVFLRSNQGVLQPWPLGIQNTGEIKQLTWVDFDNDGDRDLSMTGLDMRVQLFRNESNAFLPLPVSSGISTDTIVSYGHSWADYDRDGDLDLFVCNYDAQFMGYVNSDNQLYRNEGNGMFTDVTQAAGFQSMTNYTFMALWMDYNRDLFPDLLVINDRYEVPNYFYHNNGDGTFTEISAQANLNDYMFGMTATADDFDNDGDLDIYVTNGTSGNKHKINNGDGTFLDADVQLGTTMNRFCWAAQFVDADRDGREDLHICSTPHLNLPGQNFLYRNYGEVFMSATDSAGLSTDGGWSRASAIGDFNGDGLADVAICKSAPSFSNVWSALPSDNHWLKVTLEGTQSNRDGVSSWIDCYTSGLRQSRYTYCGEGYLGQNSFSEFIGCGAHEMIDSLIVSWPSGVVDRWYNIPANQQLYLVEGTSRRVAITSSGAFQFCVSDTIALSVNGWQQVVWNNVSASNTMLVHEPGAFWVLAHDEWGNQFMSDTVWASYYPSPIMNAVVEAVTCSGLNDGRIVLNADVSGLVYSVDGDVFFASELNSLSGGHYVISWFDTLGCSGTLQLEVHEPLPFNAQAVPTGLSCYGANDGRVEFLFSGGTPDYSLLGDNVNTSQLAAGEYVFVVSDSNGCLQLLTVSIHEPEPLVLETTSLPEIDATSNGAITCNVTGGTPPYVFSLDNAISDTSNWQQLMAGAYEVAVIDSMGCVQSQQVMVDALTAVEFMDNAGVLVFPNPVKQGEQLFIKTTEPIEQCVLLNACGKIVFQSNTAASLIQPNRETLSSGIYTIRLKAGDRYRSMRVVVVD
jgi:hypothetical protein